MEPLQVFFLGREQGFLADARGPWRRRRIENSRQGEEAAFHQCARLRRTHSIAEADIVFVRNKPERTRRIMSKLIARRLDRSARSRYVVNPIAAFEAYQAKNAAFDAWRQHGIGCPDHRLWQPGTAAAQILPELLAFMRAHESIFLRTNNEDCGKGIVPLDSGTPRAEVGRALRALKRRARFTRVSDTRIMAVARIRPSRDRGGVTRVFRAHVYEDEILGGYTLAGRSDVLHAGDMRLPYLDDFVLANQALTGMLREPAIRAEIVRALHVLGCNIGAVEFFEVDGRLVFLEVNPMWGGKHRFGDEAFQRHLVEHEAQLSEKIPNVYDWLDGRSYYRRLFEGIYRHARGRIPLKREGRREGPGGPDRSRPRRRGRSRRHAGNSTGRGSR